jgi:hypothetical protein
MGIVWRAAKEAYLSVIVEFAPKFHLFLPPMARTVVQWYLDPAEIRVLKIYFAISRPQKKKKIQPDGGAAFPPACAIGAYIGLRGQNALKKSVLGWVNF